MATEPTPEALDKLPKWAQAYVRALRFQLHEAQDMAGLSNVEGSPVSWGTGMSERVRLPARAEVRFQLSQWTYVDVAMRDEYQFSEGPHDGTKENVLRVAVGGAWSRLVIHPSASNSVHVFGRR